MGIEIERKFLVKQELLPESEGTFYRQGYLNSDKDRTVRIRTINDKAFLTIKGITVGCCRQEFEYEIPFRDADEILTSLCEKPIIEKKRFKIDVEGWCFEVDQFLGENEGLIIAEIELPSEDSHFPKPEWLGNEVTEDPRYYNSNLSRKPYKNWN